MKGMIFAAIVGAAISGALQGYIQHGTHYAAAVITLISVVLAVPLAGLVGYFVYERRT